MILYAPSTWEAEAKQLGAIIRRHHATFKEVTSDELNQMSLEEVLSFSLLIVPGGYAPFLTASLTADTHAKLRKAVQVGGLDYLGFCAGAWIAVGPAPAEGKDMSYGIGLADGPFLIENFLSNRGLEISLDRAVFPGGRRQDLLWYGGPITPEVPGGVVARYSDGTPAISQIKSGNGMVILSGLHPAVTPAMLDALKVTSQEAIDPDLAWQLIEAGILQKPLPAF